jgi:hypothetical protein
MLYMVAITLKTNMDVFLQLMIYSSANCRVLLLGLLANAASTTSAVPPWRMFVDGHFSVGHQHFQSF